MGQSKVAAVPSAELRRAITCFRSAVQAAVQTVHAREKVDAVTDDQVVFDVADNDGVGEVAPTNDADSGSVGSD